MSPLFHLLAVFSPWVLEKREEEEVRGNSGVDGGSERKEEKERERV